MEKIAYLNEKDRIEELKYNFENGIVKSEDITPDDRLLLTFMYQLEMISLDNQIEERKEILDDYKIRLKNAIDYLRNKNSNK